MSSPSRHLRLPSKTRSCAALRAAARWLARSKPFWLVAGALLAILVALDRLFPPPRPDPAPHALVVLARDGTPLRAFPDRGHVWRHAVRIEQVSPRYLEALLAYEDRFFYWHPGINPVALARAGWQWLVSGRIVSGGSTLTMQVARLLEPSARTVPAKLRQCARALQLELRYSKREILELYLNHAPMGGVLEGVEAASRAYLGKPAARLTHAEAALLAVLPQAPSAFRPDRHPHAARVARDKVLRRMAARWGKALVADAAKEAVYAPLLKPPLLAPLLAERLRRERPGSERIETTLDAATQATLELLLADRASQLPPRVSIAALVVDNQSLEVLAYAGSADFSDSERFAHVDMVRAQRSPGSALKPFLYAHALDDGLIHSESLLADVPQSFGGYQPGNFQQSFHGPVSVAEALVRSLNVPAVEVLDRLGPTRFVSQLRRGGLVLQLPRGAEPNLSVALGGAGVSLEDLTGAYTAFARGGLAGRPRLYPDAPLQEARMMSEGASFIVRDILESGSVADRAINTASGVSRRVALKTGTSFGFRDAWAFGVSQGYTVGVWIGRPDGTPNPGHFGANAAAPLLLDIFAALPEALAVPAAPPATATQAPICWPLGVREGAVSPELCHVRRTAWLLHDTAPPTFPDKVATGERRYAFHVSASDAMRVEPDCANGSFTRVDAARWPVVLEAWLDPGLRKRALPPAWSPTCALHARQRGALQIVGLTDGERLHRAAHQAPLVRLALHGQAATVHWLVNGLRVARTEPGESLMHRLESPGRYEITAFEDTGSYDRIGVSVR